MIGLVPSILSADFTRLGEQVREAEAAGAQRIQIDVMDGHFVPNITMGPLVVEAVRRCTQPTIGNPLDDYKSAGLYRSVRSGWCRCYHCTSRSVSHLHRIIQQIKAHGKQAAVALNPSTPVFLLQEVLSMLDMVLIMTVNPGFGGQDFIPETLQKSQHSIR